MTRTITRTIKSCTATILALNEKEELEKVCVVVTGDTSDDAIKEEFKFVYPEFTFIKVKEYEKSEKLYGMPETEFIKYAKVIEKRYDLNAKN